MGRRRGAVGQLWAIFYEGRQYGPALAEYKIRKRYKSLSKHLLNIDMRRVDLRPGGEIDLARMRRDRFRVVGD